MTPMRSWNAFSATATNPTGRAPTTATKASRSSFLQVDRTVSAWPSLQSGCSRRKISSPKTSWSEAKTGSHARSEKATTASRSSSASSRISIPSVVIEVPGLVRRGLSFVGWQLEAGDDSPVAALAYRALGMPCRHPGNSALGVGDDIREPLGRDADHPHRLVPGVRKRVQPVRALREVDDVAGRQLLRTLRRADG